jgi:hypothetical protein
MRQTAYFVSAPAAARPAKVGGATARDGKC